MHVHKPDKSTQSVQGVVTSPLPGLSATEINKSIWVTVFGHRVRDFRGLLWHLAARVLFTSFLSSVHPHCYTSLVAPPDYSTVHKSLVLSPRPPTSLCSHLPPTPSVGLSCSLSHAAHFSRVHFSSVFCTWLPTLTPHLAMSCLVLRVLSNSAFRLSI